MDPNKNDDSADDRPTEKKKYRSLGGLDEGARRRHGRGGLERGGHGGQSPGRAQRQPPPPRPTTGKLGPISLLAPAQLAVEEIEGGHGCITSKRESIVGGHGRITSKHAPPSMLAHQRIAIPLHGGEGAVGGLNLGGAIGSSSSSSSLTEKKYRSLGELDADASRRHGRGGHERGGSGGQSPGRAQRQPPPPRPTTGKLGPISILAPARLAVEVGGRGQRMGAGLGATRLVLAQGTSVEFDGGGHDHISSSKQASSTSMAPSDGSKKIRSGEGINGRHVRGRSRTRAQPPPPPRSTIEKLTPEQLAGEVGAGGRRMGAGFGAERLVLGRGTGGGGHDHISSSKQASSTSMAPSDGSKKGRSGERVDGRHVRGRSRARAQPPPPPRPTIENMTPEQLAVEVGAGGRRIGTGLEGTRLTPGQATSVDSIGGGDGRITSKHSPPSMVAHQRIATPLHSGEVVVGRSNLGGAIGSSSSSAPFGSSNIGGVTRSYQVLVDDGKGVDTGAGNNNMRIGTAGELNHRNVGDADSPTYKDLEDITTLPKVPPSLPPC